MPRKLKDRRRERIRELISNEHIATQMELSQRLMESGFQVTQATVSRDIRELRLVKISDGDGTYHYSLGEEAGKPATHEKFYPIFQSSIVRVDWAQNLVVIHTETGMAQAVCATMDNMKIPGVLGTVAGDDTILAVVKTEAQAAGLADTLQRL